MCDPPNRGPGSAEPVSTGCRHDKGALGSLLRFRGDQPGGDEDATDRGTRRWPKAVWGQPRPNRNWAVIEADGLQLAPPVQIRSRSSAATARELPCGHRDRVSTA